MPHTSRKNNMIGLVHQTQQDKNTGIRVTLDTAETHMKTFIKYYKGINLVPGEEWKHFMESICTMLPPSFRFRENHHRCINVYETRPGTLGQAEVLKEYMCTHVLPKVADKSHKDKQFELTPIPWYPGGMGWRCNLIFKTINNIPQLSDLATFVKEEERASFLSKQDVTSMVPVLLADVKPQHKILEMCGAPGFQTAQLLELLNANNKRMPDGFLISNDKERDMYRWHQSTNVAFTHEDPSTFPDLYTTHEHTPESKLLYDRIFIDAPTSGDGTFRKNPNMRASWTVGEARRNHKELKAILHRGVELLEYNGQLVYTTNSLNPSENEAVVAAILKQAEGALQLVDVSKRLPGLHLRPGMTSWKVMTVGGIFYSKFASCPTTIQKELEESLFPPPEQDVLQYHLDNSVRMMPHDNDTGGCYIAVLTKTAALPWQKGEESMEIDTIMSPSGDAKQVEKQVERPQYVKPLRCDITVNVCGIEWEVESTDAQLNTTSETSETFYERSPLAISKTSLSPWLKKQLTETTVNFEDVEPDNDKWNTIRQMYDIKRIDPVPNLLQYTSQTSVTMFFYCSPVIKTLLKYNNQYFKKCKGHAGGLMIMKHMPGGDVDLLPFEGHLPFIPYMEKRVVNVTRVDMITILESKDLAISALADRIQKDLAGIEDNVTVYFIYDPKGKNADPKCTIIQRRRKTDTHVKNMDHTLPEEHHNLRLCGVDPTANGDKME